ncbi:type II toxin-antitoxin system RelE/ParE family toxin [Streptomyces sp. NBC_01267]|uniref:type II toxin-antitoxin system RelE family toxin n=1 Tax=unclassified Streptomyces TaxID=2593676 RepID=UPI0020258CF2|nr:MULTISPECIES: type II toxin-antitoxin system RelE/ParE family toxin [unclassified Streptomyces]MCX4551476.1 type II toxin-antitoxin system RelE/ParE family toxin [Streptomyces sp. NBC_01500]
MKYTFRFTERARRDLRGIDQPGAMRILAALTRLGDDPYRADADIKKLTDQHGIYRLRVGDFRVAYTVDDGQLIILVIKIGNRRDIYRNL